MPVGTDATHPATDALITLASQLLRAPPAFFGRFFKGPHNPSPIQYQPAQENPVLRAHGIKVLCIARQTNRIGGTSADGVADAVNNMAALVDAFGASYLASLGMAPLIFLDTEPSPNPTLSAAYYAGWAGALQNQGPVSGATRLTFTPGVYINRSDTGAWTALANAMHGGTPCHGAWVADYGSRTGAEGPPPWDPTAVDPAAPTVAPCPILAWQYAGDYEDVLDFSAMPPDASANATMALMVPPPPSAPVASVGANLAALMAPLGQAGTYTLRHNTWYRATLTLSLFEQFAGNDIVASKFASAGFTNVTVTGSGSTRIAQGFWPGPDTTGAIPSEVTTIAAIAPLQPVPIPA
jgi:hypothetical protein